MFGIWVKKKELELEVKQLSALLDIAKSKQEAELSIAKSRVELEAEKKLQGQYLLYKEGLQKVEADKAKEVSELKSSLAKEYYDKMQDALRELNLEGGAQSKFVQELSLKMFDKALEKPMPSHFISERLVTNDSES